MGIDNTAAKMLMLLRNERGINFGQTIILGRQHNYIGPILRRRVQINLGLSKTQLPLSSKYSEDFLTSIGIEKPEILDVSDYEGATILHDLNFPIASNLMNAFSAVIDIGTSEHIYNITQALQNLKDLCAVNGHLLIVSPANSWLGHGFYQFSPELFFRTFDSKSGFEIRHLFLIKQRKTGDAWYELTDPKSLGRRGTILTRSRCSVAVVAQKISTEVNRVLPQQSDYVPAWDNPNISKLGTLYLNMPWIVRRVIEITVLPIKNKYENRMNRVKLSWKTNKVTVIRR